MQVAGEQEKAYTQLARLLPKGSLRQFIEQHPEFDVEEKEGLLCIKWGSAAPQRVYTQLARWLGPAAFAPVTSASAASPRSAQKNNSSLTAAASGAPSASTSGAPPDFDQMD